MSKPSPIQQALANLKMLHRGPQCSLGALLGDLKENDPEGYKALQAAIEDRNINAPTLVRALAEAGHRLHRDTIVRHRRRGTATGCRCES